MDLKEMECKEVDLIHVVQDMNQSSDLVNTENITNTLEQLLAHSYQLLNKECAQCTFLSLGAECKFRVVAMSYYTYVYMSKLSYAFSVYGRISLRWFFSSGIISASTYVTPMSKFYLVRFQPDDGSLYLSRNVLQQHFVTYKSCCDWRLLFLLLCISFITPILHY